MIRDDTSGADGFEKQAFYTIKRVFHYLFSVAIWVGTAIALLHGRPRLVWYERPTKNFGANETLLVKGRHTQRMSRE